MFGVMTSLFGPAIVLAAVVWTGVRTQNNEVLTSLLREYDATIPAPSSPPINVSVRLFIDLITFDEATERMTIHVFLKQKWLDSRLQFRNYQNIDLITVPKTFRDKLWLPDTFFKKALTVEANDHPTEQMSLYINKDGNLSMTGGYTATFYCPRAGDERRCPIYVEAYKLNGGYTLQFGDLRSFLFADLVISGWQIGDYILENCSAVYSAGATTCLSWGLTFRRTGGHVISHVHVPFIFLLIATYANYFIGRKLALLRFGYLFLIGVLMCCATIRAEINTPDGAVNTGANELWLGMGFFLYFCAVVNCVVVLRCVQKGSAPDKVGPHTAMARMIDRAGMVSYPAILIVWLIVHFAAFG